MLLDKSAFLKATTVKTEDVEIKGGSVRVSELGGEAYLSLYTDPLYQTADGNIDMVKFTPALLANTIINEDGSRMFTDSEIAEVGRRDADSFLKLANCAKRLNGLTGDEIKNSEASPEISSCIDCACISDTDTLTNSLPDSPPAS